MDIGNSVFQSPKQPTHHDKSLFFTDRVSLVDQLPSSVAQGVTMTLGTATQIPQASGTQRMAYVALGSLRHALILQERHAAPSMDIGM